jgi:hypothetical protein
LPFYYRGQCMVEEIAPMILEYELKPKNLTIWITIPLTIPSKKQCH